MSEKNNATYSGIFSKGYLSALKNTPIDNDKIKIATDSRQLFIDTDNERFEITDFVKDHTEEEIRGILAPLPKLYLASDTGRILIHNGEEWIVVAEKNADVVAKALEADRATNADTATYASNASVAETATKATKATNADTATYAQSAGTANNASEATHATSADTATKATSADSATKATNADTATYAKNASTATYATSAASATKATTATNADTATYAKNAGTATSATNSSTAEYAKNAAVASKATSADSATKATTADSATKATTATNADTATYAKNAGTADNATKATNADTATYATKAASATSADTATKATSAGSATKATQDANGKVINSTYAPLASPALTGTPTAPTAAEGASGKQVANTEFVAKAIANTVAGITDFETVIVESLPTTGVKGTIYFVLNGSSETDNIYDEYIWVNGKFEKIGSTKIDLTGYLNDVGTSGTGNAVTGYSVENGKLTLKKDSTFLTAHPSVTSSSTTGTEAPAAGKTFDVVDGVVTDKNGHVTAFRKKTVTMPNSVASATSAGSATKATQDSAGQQINTTYLKNLAISGRTITATKGDGSTFTLTTQDNNTTYAAMKGATSAAAGSAGLVPAPAKGNQGKFLRGDGTWASPTAGSVADGADFDFGDLDG